MLFSHRTVSKWRLAVCTIAQDFRQEQDFSGSNLITADHVRKTQFWQSKPFSVVLELRRSIPLWTPNSAGKDALERSSSRVLEAR
jgi:hypothetical protein